MREEKGACSLIDLEMTTNFARDGLSDSRMSYLLDNIPEMVFFKDAEGYYTYMNVASLACMGRDPTFLRGRRLKIHDIAPPEMARQLDEIDSRILATGEGVYDSEQRVVSADGQVRWYSGTRIPVRNDHGDIVGIAGISRDITEAKWQESLRRSHAALLEMIVHGKPLQLILEAVVRTVEDLLDNLTGSILLIEQNRLRSCVGPNLPESYVAAVDGVEIGPQVGSCGTAAWRRQAVYVSDTFQDPLWSNFIDLVMRHGLRSCWSTPIFGNNGVLHGTFALYSGTVRMPSAIEREIIDMATNIAGIAIDRRRAEDKVNYMAHHDPLTGLSNRNLFWSQFQRAIHEARRENRLVAVTYIDLDNFKEINDVYGHGVGDEVLRSLAERIKNCIRESDIAVRLGGDEFAIIFSNPQHDEPGILQRLKTIRERAAEPIELDVGSLTVTCSSGTAFYPSDGETPEALLAKADAAMYEVKKNGRNGVRFFAQSWGDGI